MGKPGGASRLAPAAAPPLYSAGHDRSPETPAMPTHQKSHSGIIPRQLDPYGIADAILQAQRAWAGRPWELAAELGRLGQGLLEVQAHAWLRATGTPQPDVVPPVKFDARFQHPAWTDNPLLDAWKEYYLLYVRWLEAAFWVRQALNAAAPTNWFFTNPEAVLRAMESGGRSLGRGLQNLARDINRGSISMTDPEGFEVGRDLATTPGKVVMRNELLELIQYRPTTERVQQVPIVLVSPWINKFYILDLNPKKSLVRWLVDQGFTVFVTSWKNPPAAMRDTRFEDYMLKGAHAAVECARDITGSPQVNLTGYCIGGTLVTAYLAWLAAGNGTEGDNPVAHWTLFTTLTDFTHPGEIDVFIDEDTIRSLEDLMAQRGYLDGREMAESFRLLRSNTLIWHFFVHNYLYGEDPPPFDVLFWNMDSTRMPQAMHSFYLRAMYLENRLARPGALQLAGRKLDMGRIRQPLYAVGTEQDHIAPWKETFRTCHLVGGSVRYTLATSGHILGIITPPVDPPKRRYWAGDATDMQAAEAWRERTDKVPGSWWEDWVAWLRPQSGAEVPPPTLGNARYPALADAPGSYVLER